MSVNYEELGLTEEEIAAINTDEDGNATEAEEEAVDADEGEEEVTEEVTQEEAAGAEVADPKPEPEAQGADAPVFVPQFSANPVADYQARRSQLDRQFDQMTDDLAQRYEAGDLDFKTYRKHERELTREYQAITTNLEAAQLKAEIAHEHSRQSTEALWKYEQQVFFADNPEFASDDILAGALGAKLQSMYEDPANQGKSGLAFLREAASAVKARFGIASQAAKEPTHKEAIADAVAKRTQKAKPLPKTLGDLPAAETNEDGGEFDYLDKLKGLDYEKAIASMSEAQRARFLA